jgi:glycosyltransferase involved in cell wall biosynthesis
MGVITILTSLLALHVTVVVACRNENSTIRELLDSLVRLDPTNLVLDAVIADGMSTDGTRRVLDEFARTYPWCTVIDNPGRIVSTGLNRAIPAATGEFIVRMDAHTVYEPDYVVRSIEVLQATGAHNAGGPQRSRARGYWPRAIHAGFHSPFASGGARFRDDRYSGPVDTVPYGCWRRDFLIGIGLFDETLVRNQDDELNLRIRLAGGIVWQDPTIVSWYSPRSTLGELFRQYFQYGFWRVAVLRKHPGRGSLRHFVPGAAALLGLSIVLLIALGIERSAAEAVLLVLGFLYLVLSLYAALRAAGREGWDLLPALPISFAFYQSAYAAGFCVGLVYWSLRERSRKNPRGISGARPDNST